MCGISVMINLKKKPILVEEIKALNEKIFHRGPDNEGYLLKDHFAFGHRRLSIIDKSVSGNQPLKCRNYSIIYNGEVYNYIELKQELEELGYDFISHTDTEVVVAAYAKWGIKAFEKFNGMWAFAIYDALKNEIIICRDNFGIKPVNYTLTENYFLVGSEIKQFTSIPEFKAVLNKQVAFDFIENGMLNQSENTFFENVYELKSGHYLKFDLNNNQYQIKQWYNLEQSIVSSKDDFQTAKHNVKSLFDESVKLRMRSDVTVGSCLSGGLDSSSIVCSIKENNLFHDSFTTITSCFENKQFDEQVFSDEVIKFTNFQSEKIFPNANHLFEENILDKIVYHHDQPIPSGSHYSEYGVCKKAKEKNIIVLLDGQGSDEYLFGYPEFYFYYLKELFYKFKYITFFKEIKDKAKIENTSVYKELKNFTYNLLVIPASNFFKKNFYKNKEGNILQFDTIKNDNNIIPKSIQQLSLLEISKTSLPYQLHSLDRNSMMFSIEARLPFLDKNLMEYCIGLPSSYKIKNGFKKFILREALTSLPDNIKYRKDKMAYEAPDEIWMRKYNEYVNDQLNKAVNELKFINSNILKQYQLFLNMEIPYNPIFFRVLSFYRFYKIFNF